MRLLARNKKELWFSNPSGTSWVTDSNGLKTGEKEVAYTTPTKALMSIGVATDRTELEVYGINVSYTHTAVTEDMNCGMGEESIVWFGIPPTHEVEYQSTVNGETVTLKKEEPNPHNYVCVCKSPSLNHIVYFLKEVNVG